MLASLRGVNGLHVALEQDFDSAADGEALPRLERKVPPGWGRPLWRPVAAGLLALLALLAVFGAARRDRLQSGTLLGSLASIKEGSIVISAVDSGSTKVEVEDPGLFNVGDNITILDTAPGGQDSSMENAVVGVGVNHLVLRDPVTRAFPEYSFIVPKSGPAPPASPTPAPAPSASEGADVPWSLTIASALFAVATCCTCCVLAGLFVMKPRVTTTTPAEEAGSKKRITRTTFVTKAGQSELRVETTGGFYSGDKVLISSDTADEYGIIRDLEDGDIMVLAQPLRCAHPAAAVISAQGNTRVPRRNALINELFQVLDIDCNRHLNSSELLVLAKLDGFRGSGEEWDEQYSRLVRNHLYEYDLGCNHWQFESLVNDRDGGLYITSDDIRQYLVMLEGRLGHQLF